MTENITSVIKIDIDNNCFVWKYPLVGFNTWFLPISRESLRAAVDTGYSEKIPDHFATIRCFMKERLNKSMIVK